MGQPQLIGLPQNQAELINPGEDFWGVCLVVAPNGTRLVRADFTSWALRVYDRQSASEETPIYTLLAQVPTATNPDGSAILSATLQTDGFKRHPEGYVLKHKLLSSSLWTPIGGRSYNVVYELITAIYGSLKYSIELGLNAKV